MALIAAYTFTPAPVMAYLHSGEGWDATTKALTPMGNFASAWASGVDGFSSHQVFDNITLAVEAGVIDNKKWVKQIFKTPKDCETFIEYLEGYNECFTIFDRWWQAFACLAERYDMEEFVSSAEIADGLRQYAIETKQIKG